mgnify:CR=1 FL=1
MIVSFRHAGLRELFETGRSRKVQPDLHKRCRRAMDALHAATALSDLNMPGWSVHPLKGNREGRHAMAVSGPWRITFRWDGDDAAGVEGFPGPLGPLFEAEAERREAA